MSLLLILIRTFIEFLNLRCNLMYVLPDNGLIRKILKYSLSKQPRSFINPIIDPIQNFLKRFTKHWFRINHCFSREIKINESKFHVSIFFGFLPSKSLAVIWYLKALFLPNKSLNKSLMVDLLVSNWTKAFFEFIT